MHDKFRSSISILRVKKDINERHVQK